MISNLIIAAVLILFVLLGCRRGFAASVLNAVGVAVTGFFTYYISGFLSSWAYTAFIKQALIENLQQLITSQGIDTAVDSSFAALPSWANGLVNCMFTLLGTDSGEYTSGFDVSSISNALTSGANTAAVSIESMVEPVVSSVLQMIIGAVVSIIIFIFIKLIIKKLLVIFNVPVVKQINGFLGGVLGLVEGLVISFIGINIYSAFLYYTNSSLLSSSMVRGGLFDLFSAFV